MHLWWKFMILKVLKTEICIYTKLHIHVQYKIYPYYTFSHYFHIDLFILGKEKQVWYYWELFPQNYIFGFSLFLSKCVNTFYEFWWVEKLKCAFIQNKYDLYLGKVPNIKIGFYFHVFYFHSSFFPPTKLNAYLVSIFECKK